MPYDTLSDLPGSVRDDLPKRAQETYRSAYDDAWDGHVGGDRREHGDSRPTAHPAWGAVEQEDETQGGRWTQKS